MTIPSITPDPLSPPDPPTRGDPDNFRSRADTFVDWQAEDFPTEIGGFITEMNASITQMNAVSTQVDLDATDALNAEAVAVAAANFVGEWDDLTGSYSVPTSCFHDNFYWMLLDDLADVTSDEPREASTKWQLIWTNAMTHIYRTSNTVLTFSNNSDLIEVTSGTFTQTISAVSTLRPGWFCYYKNSGTGVVTINPDSTETIDGQLTATIESGDTFLIQCDGTNFQCSKIAGKKPHYITADDATWTVPAGVIELFVQVWGAGGGGGYRYNATNCPSAGGGGGGYTEKTIPVTAGTSIAITVGEGGAGGATGGGDTTGTGGETSSFGTYCSATGGAGSAGSNSYTPSVGGAGADGDINITGGQGLLLQNASAAMLNSCAGGSYGTPCNWTHGTVVPALYPGGGGPGTWQGLTPAAGADGLVIIWY